MIERARALGRDRERAKETERRKMVAPPCGSWPPPLLSYWTQTRAHVGTLGVGTIFPQHTTW
jgi:hypothetical protein